MSNFGASFRKAREAAGLPLDKIAAETRISTRFLLAIESEDFHLLPGGVFNRGFVRAYASHLGMDPEQAVTEYSRISATSDEPLDVLRNVEEASSRKAERNLYPVIIGLLLLLVAVYYFINRRSIPRADETTGSNVVQEASPRPAEGPSPGVIGPSDTATQTAAVEPLPAVSTTNTGATEPANRSLETQKGTASPFEVSALVLELDVKELTWIRVSTDGMVALNDSVSPGTTRRFSAERSIDITLGNAGGATLKINGRDMGQLGARGQVREFKITPENATRIQG
jgi:cytoskeleton protein RodZ